jgi:hypothetical protein
MTDGQSGRCQVRPSLRGTRHKTSVPSCGSVPGLSDAFVLLGLASRRRLTRTLKVSPRVQVVILVLLFVLIVCLYVQIIEIHMSHYDINSIRLSILLDLPDPNSDWYSPLSHLPRYFGA